MSADFYKKVGANDMQSATTRRGELNFGHRQAELVLRTTLVTPGHEIAGRENASLARFLFRPFNSPIKTPPKAKAPLWGAFVFGLSLKH